MRRSRVSSPALPAPRPGARCSVPVALPLPRRLRRLWLGAAVATLGWPAAASPPLEQLPETAACVSETGHAGACADGTALQTPFAVAVSPDGLSVYVGVDTSDAIAVFDRDPATGAIVQKPGAAGCWSETGAAGCADGVALDFPRSVAVSPDGRNVYVAAFSSNAVAVFERDPLTGALAQLAGTDACVNDDGSGGCADGEALLAPFSVAVSPDGRNVYVASLQSDAVAVFDRDLESGALTQKAGLDACVSEANTVCTGGVALDNPTSVVVSPDGRGVYVGTVISDGIAVFDRDRTSGTLLQKAGTAGCITATGTGGQCQTGVGLLNVEQLAMSPDGRHLYAASFVSEAVAVFDRTLETGALTQKAGTAGCVSATGSGGACAVGTNIGQPSSLAVSPDGRAVHVAMFAAGVTSFDRDRADGTLSQHGVAAACWHAFGAGGCRDAVGLLTPVAIASSGDGRNVYAADSQAGSVAAFAVAAAAYDIDGDGQVEALTDGLLLVRFAFGLGGAVLIDSAVDLANCTRCTAAAIEAYLEALSVP